MVFNFLLVVNEGILVESDVVKFEELKEGFGIEDMVMEKCSILGD